MRVLLVAQDGPTSGAVGALRAVSFTKYLASRGDEVALLTTAQSPSTPLLVTPDEGDAWRDLVNQEFCTLVPRPTGDARQTRKRTFADHRRATAIRVTAFRIRAAFWDWPDVAVSRAWRRRAVELIRGEARDLKPDIVVSTAPSWSNHLAARDIARELDIPWVPDYRDLWTNCTYYQQPRLRWELDSRWEKRVLSDAAAVTAVSPELVRSLNELAPDLPGYTVMNGFDRDVLVDVPVQDLGAGRHVVYAGIIYPGKRDPMPLIKAMATLPQLADLTLHLVGLEPHHLPPEARSLGLGERLRFIGRVDRKLALSYVKSADVALLLTWNDPREAGVVSAKSFEYIGLGKPILALGYEHGRMARVLEDYGYGRFANDPHSINDALEEMLAWVDAGLVADPARVAVFDRNSQLTLWREVLLKYAQVN